MTLITYARRPVAMAGPERLYLAAHINQRPDGDPLKTFVCFLALYARDVQLGRLPAEPRRYLPRRAERYARAALMPHDHAPGVRVDADEAHDPAFDARIFARLAYGGLGDRLADVHRPGRQRPVLVASPSSA